MRLLPALVFAAALPSLAAAQPAPAALTRLEGTVAAIAADGLTIRTADGKETALGLAPELTVVETRIAPKEAVKPGSFVASANLSQADGVGRSIEIRMFEPGRRAGEGSRPMTQAGAAPGQMMTNATVTKAEMTAAGLELDVAYPGGTRHLIVPADVPVIALNPVDPSSVKVGAPVVVQAQPGPGGALRAVRIQVNSARPG